MCKCSVYCCSHVAGPLSCEVCLCLIVMLVLSDDVCWFAHLVLKIGRLTDGSMPGVVFKVDLISEVMT